nr:MAG TPA: hypothetical protein [Caudoviricetes sp.]
METPAPSAPGRPAHCVRNCADSDTLKHERFSTQECVQSH